MTPENIPSPRMVPARCGCANCELFTALMHTEMLNGIASKLLDGGRRKSKPRAPLQLLAGLVFDEAGELRSGTYVMNWASA